jgi:membrane protein
VETEVTVNSAFAFIKALYKKYRGDNGNIIVSSISFYLLLTFIPFTLLAISALGYIIDLTDLDEHFLHYMSNVIPAPQSETIIRRITSELHLMDLTKNVSGPLGLLALFFFTSKLFSILIPSFHIIFGERSDSFLKGQEKGLLFNLLFSVAQAIIFFVMVFTIISQSQVMSAFSEHIIIKGVLSYLLSFLDLLSAFSMFCLLYYLLTPARKRKARLFALSALATFLWGCGKYLFKYYVQYVGRFDVLLGTYGIFVGFLFWIYYSVFVFVLCAELQALLLKTPPRYEQTCA